MTTDLSIAEAPPFQLAKWYLDCVSESGDGAILYLAELRWRKLHLRYANRLLFLGGRITSKTSIRHCELPHASGDEIRVTIPHLDTDGVWRRAAERAGATVFAGQEGEVVWNSLHPSSNVRLRVEANEIEGRGYAEHLQMTIPPWKLPLTELHWGRFISQSTHVVWIDWRGPYRFQLLERGGARENARLISETEIQFAQPDTVLSLDRGFVLRDGNLGDTVFPALSPVVKLLPSSLFGVHECKWRSRGVLRQRDRSDEGWAIHEVVRWQSP